MFKKGSKLYSIFTGTCPHCQEESMYEDKNPYNLTNVYKMHERCSHCGQRYKIEPSFFYGAMYVSYGVGVAIGIAVFIIAFVFLQTSLLTSFIAINVALIALMPVIMRVSRNIWINFFVHYDPDWKAKKQGNG
jgi:uncharacterized protein (DUF983 family)